MGEVSPSATYIEMMNKDGVTWKVEVEPNGDGTFRIVTSSSLSAGGDLLTEATGQDILAALNDTVAALATLNATSTNIETAAEDTSAVPIQGFDAEDAAVTAKPVIMGGKVSDAYRSAMSADGDSITAWLDRRGRTIVNLGVPRALKGDFFKAMSADTNVQTILAATSNVKNNLTGLMITNPHATTAAKFTLLDDDGTTVRATINVPAGETRGCILPGCILTQTAVNKAWKGQLSAAVAMEITGFYDKEA